MKKKIVCFGPGPQFKGGIAHYNISLAKALHALDNIEVHIVSWTQQYPAIIPRKFQDPYNNTKHSFLYGTNIPIISLTNFNHFWSWYRTYHYILSLQPTMVIFQCAISLQGIPIGWLTKWLKRHHGIEVVMDMHFVTQKEPSWLDNWLVKWGFSKGDIYIVHDHKTYEAIRKVYPTHKFYHSTSGVRGPKNTKTVIKLYHPIYEIFPSNPHLAVQSLKKELNLKKNVFLFFGFIRKYKGVHNLIKAFKVVAEQRDDVSLLICGESFWDTLDNRNIFNKIKKKIFELLKRCFIPYEKKEYDQDQPLDLIQELGLEKDICVINQYIPNEEVHKYFQISNCTVLYYTVASSSGVEAISYYFGLPILATAVGHFPDTIQEGKNGYLAMPGNIASMANTMLHFLDNPIHADIVKKTTSKMTWNYYAQTIIGSS